MGLQLDTRVAHHQASVLSLGIIKKEIMKDARLSRSSRICSRVLPHKPLLGHEKITREDLSSAANYIHIGKISLQDIETNISNLKPQSSPPGSLPALILNGCKLV